MRYLMLLKQHSYSSYVNILIINRKNYLKIFFNSYL